METVKMMRYVNFHLKELDLVQVFAQESFVEAMRFAAEKDTKLHVDADQTSKEIHMIRNLVVSHLYQLVQIIMIVQNPSHVSVKKMVSKIVPMFVNTFDVDKMLIVWVKIMHQFVNVNLVSLGIQFMDVASHLPICVKKILIVNLKKPAN